MTESEQSTEIAIIGAGIAGIAAAYYLCCEHAIKSVVLIDRAQPMSYTSAQSGDNYRNWWPHPVMAEFTDHSIDLMEKIATDSSNTANMNQHGYVLATQRADIEDLLSGLRSDDEVFSGLQSVRDAFPDLNPDIQTVVRINKAGSFSSQQLAQYMLEKIRNHGGRLLRGEVVGIEHDGDFKIRLRRPDGESVLQSSILINAAGPFANAISKMTGTDLPLKTIFQQKVAFEDTQQAIPRNMPFCIDLDERTIGWSQEERSMLEDEPAYRWLTEATPANVHCRPDGGLSGRWVKLGWAYNREPSDPQVDLANEPKLDRQFSEIVIRRAAEFIPALRAYVETPPGRSSHYGGYYTMTEENWPLIGPTDLPGLFILGALSGFGSMAACAAGEICANWVTSRALPDYATQLSLARYDDAEAIADLRNSLNKGVL